MCEVTTSDTSLACCCHTICVHARHQRKVSATDAGRAHVINVRWAEFITRVYLTQLGATAVAVAYMRLFCIYAKHFYLCAKYLAHTKCAIFISIYRSRFIVARTHTAEFSHVARLRRTHQINLIYAPPPPHHTYV